MTIIAKTLRARDYTGDDIEDILVRSVFAENGAAYDGEVTLSLCRHDHTRSPNLSDDTWGYEVDLTPDEADTLADSLRNAAEKARHEKVSS